MDWRESPGQLLKQLVGVERGVSILPKQGEGFGGGWGGTEGRGRSGE